MTRFASASAAVLLAASVLGCRSPEGPVPTRIVTYTSPMWYEETGRYFQVAPDGRRALYGSGARERVYDLTTGAEIHDAARAPFDAARFTPGGQTVSIGDAGGTRIVRLDGRVNGVSWTPSRDALYAIVLHTDGLSSLVRISTDGAVTVVRPQLDASPFFNSLAFSDDGQTIFLALASDGIPDPKARHDPEAAHRDLDIYALNLGSGRLRPVVQRPDDDCCPYVAGGFLYWTHNDPKPEIVVFPADDSLRSLRPDDDLRAVADHGFLPRWSPDGRQIAFTRGYYRLSDYGLDMDGWVVGVDPGGAVTAPAKAWITGYGEDMGPVWSPDGRWVAYHSHRSATPVPLYESPGRTDDTWLMRAAGGPELRLTDFGFEVGPPDWAPDGRHLIFDSWDKDGVPRFAKPWIITIDPATGRSLGAARMPLPAHVAGIAGEAWSPRRNEIAFVERIDDLKRALWLSQPDGAGAHKLVDFSSYTIGGVAWTPDGNALLYGALADDRMQIFSIARDGGPVRQLTRGDVNIMHPSVSPEGRLVAASRIPWKKELWRMKLRTGGL